MFKKAMMLAVAAAALVAFAIPATASAKWQEHGSDISQDVPLQVTGTSEFHGEIGGLTCQTDATATLLAGTTTASVTSFGVDLTEAGSTVTSKCSVDSTLASFGCTDVGQVTVAGLPWTGHATSTQRITVTTGTIQNHLHGGIFCPKTIQLTPGEVDVVTSTTSTWTQGDLEGELEAHSAVGAQDVVITGDGVVTPSGKYGVA